MHKITIRCILMWVLLFLMMKYCASVDIREHINSQLWLNGTTSLSRSKDDSTINMHFNQPLEHSIPLVNYSHLFNVRQIHLKSADVPQFSTEEYPKRQHEWENITTEGSVVCSKKIIQECKDDKVQLEFLQEKKISLEIDVLKLRNSYNFTQSLLEECKRNEAVYKSLLK